MNKWSGFYHLDQAQRIRRLQEDYKFDQNELALFQAYYDLVGEAQVENYIYQFGVPTGLLFNLKVNQKDWIVPMATEEPSVIAAANYGAKMISAGTGIKTIRQQRLMMGQIILTEIDDFGSLQKFIETNQIKILEIANDAHPSMLKRGGGAQIVKLTKLDAQTAEINILVDPKAAMGANLTNTMVEAVADYLRKVGYQVLMAILSNNAKYAVTDAQVRIPFEALVGKSDLDGSTIAKKIVQANKIEQISVNRAVTANKGIMNGIEAIVLASGNDTRNVNAALHAFAARDGQYKGLIQWKVQDDQLVGTTSMPILVGIVGGSIGIVPLVQLNHKIMKNPTVEELTDLIVSVGIAQHLAALRSLVTEGIQRGHMGLQAKSLAVQVGAVGLEVNLLADLIKQSSIKDSQQAVKLLKRIRGK
ncbi:hydroxymethylglutaryl-CoA reductase, degradative [Weissella koreensis]|uniref:3-hydroxy-3-methylglutaryl coenzyme A reductase n=1 Tax=Weissella koreensis TaxID=165096 RepID=A0A7H1MLZ3_9LACO|nr:hydroxymethylglutaryl-CoA reductase, degradative [Weissella koreensis]AVH75277.1 hydroxymethylglutaryl-CoA reductase, degradative [Weissella koreensis]QGN20501.1 hydroxymethylglutaryl-CoA reductase, degradative [Weissella koreensis]QNT64479.1 hydroxymethylglutaryl-CoA reductase, degradative [Weissella koreensis]